VSLERRVRFIPAYDKRAQGLGRHGVEVHFGLVDVKAKRAATFIIFSGWGLDREAAHAPIAADLCVCRPATKEDPKTECSASPCAWLESVCAIEHRSYRASDAALLALLTKGDEAVWEALEKLLAEASA
jgi:hypothetical protein